MMHGLEHAYALVVILLPKCLGRLPGCCGRCLSHCSCCSGASLPRQAWPACLAPGRWARWGGWPSQRENPGRHASLEYGWLLPGGGELASGLASAKVQHGSTAGA